MDFNNFENQTFDVLPISITGSNFTNCTFNSVTTFERCNLRGCTFTKTQKFVQSNVINCTGTEGCENDRSNIYDEDEEELNRRFRPEIDE